MKKIKILIVNQTIFKIKSMNEDVSIVNVLKSKIFKVDDEAKGKEIY